MSVIRGQGWLLRKGKVSPSAVAHLMNNKVSNSEREVANDDDINC